MMLNKIPTYTLVWEEKANFCNVDFWQFQYNNHHLPHTHTHRKLTVIQHVIFHTIKFREKEEINKKVEKKKEREKKKTFDLIHNILLHTYA